MEQEFAKLTVPLEWSDGKEMTVEEWGNREYEFGRRTGFRDGIKTAAEWLLKGATQAFACGHDKHATELRSLSQQIRELSK